MYKIWELKQGDVDSQKSLEDFMKTYASEVEWVKKDNYGFSRVLGFKILDHYYEIYWFHNNCHLYVGGIDSRLLQASFDTIYTDTCCPVAPGGNDNLTFTSNGNVCIRIPLEVGSLRG